MLELLDRFKEGRARIAEFLFDDLGIPFDLFCIGIAIMMGYVHRRSLKAWWAQLGQRHHRYQPIRSLTSWEQLEKHEQGYIRSVGLGIIVLLIVGFIELFFGVFSASK